MAVGLVGNQQCQADPSAVPGVTVELLTPTSQPNRALERGFAVMLWEHEAENARSAALADAAAYAVIIAAEAAPTPPPTVYYVEPAPTPAYVEPAPTAYVEVAPAEPVYGGGIRAAFVQGLYDASAIYAGEAWWIDKFVAMADHCETFWNPQAYNPAGYSGLLQFSASTWASVAALTGLWNVLDPYSQGFNGWVLISPSGLAAYPGGQWPVCWWSA